MNCPITDKNRCGLAGYSLTEVLVAVMILAIIGGAFYSALSFGFTVIDATREELRATQILTQKSEAIRLCNWDQLCNFSFIDTYDPLGTTNSAGTIYTGSVTIGNAVAITNATSYSPNIRQVTIDVYWTNFNQGKRIVQNRTFRTQVARYGIQNYIWGAGQ